MSNTTTENALIVFAERDIRDVLSDGFTGKEPIFNAEEMKRCTEDQLNLLKMNIEANDPNLATEDGRKLLKKIIAIYKKPFAIFEDGIKEIKVRYSEIPKACDKSSKAVRDTHEPVIAKLLLPLTEIKQQELLIQKWWKKEAIPNDIYSLDILISQIEDAEPLKFSTPKELEDFRKYSEIYLNECKALKAKLEAAAEFERQEQERKLREEAERIAAEKIKAAEDKAVKEAAAKARAAEATIEAERKEKEQAQREAEAAKKAAEDAVKAMEAAKAAQATPPTIPIAASAPAELSAEEIARKKAVRAKAINELSHHLAMNIQDSTYSLDKLREIAFGFAKGVYENPESAWAFNYGSDA